MQDKHNEASEKHLKNTDNESTMYIPGDSNEYQQNAQFYNQQINHAQQQQHTNAQQMYNNYNNPNQQYYNGNPQQPYYQNQQYYGNQPQSPPPRQPYYPNQPHYVGQPQPPQRPPRPTTGGDYGRRPSPQKRKKKKRKSILGKVISRVIMSLLIILLLLFGIYSCVSLSLISKIEHVDDDSRDHNADALSAKYVQSILIIGTDTRTGDERGRSDSMILLSLNKKTDEMILTSFMRDSYVDIPGYGMDKLNAAYSYGGPELLMDTIENNFYVKIDNYISVNFNAVSSIIEAAGGLDLEISDAEANEINVILINEVNELMGDDKYADLLEEGGDVHLNGKQALCYSRIRYVGNSDFERTSRQRSVITALMKKAVKSGPKFIVNVSKNALPHLTTNMSKKDLYLFSLKLPFALRYDTKQIQIPVEGSYSGEDVYDEYGNYQSVLRVDFDMNYDVLEEEIFSR